MLLFLHYNITISDHLSEVAMKRYARALFMLSWVFGNLAIGIVVSSTFAPGVAQAIPKDP